MEIIKTQWHTVSNTLGNHPLIRQDVPREISYFQLNENEKRAYQSLGDIAAFMLKEIVSALKIDIRKRILVNQLSRLK